MASQEILKHHSDCSNDEVCDVTGGSWKSCTGCAYTVMRLNSLNMLGGEIVCISVVIAVSQSLVERKTCSCRFFLVFFLVAFAFVQWLNCDCLGIGS
jgi:hypothetical protein